MRELQFHFIKRRIPFYVDFYVHYVKTRVICEFYVTLPFIIMSQFIILDKSTKMLVFVFIKLTIVCSVSFI